MTKGLNVIFICVFWFGSAAYPHNIDEEPNEPPPAKQNQKKSETVFST